MCECVCICMCVCVCVLLVIGRYWDWLFHAFMLRGERLCMHWALDRMLVAQRSSWCLAPMRGFILIVCSNSSHNRKLILNRCPITSHALNI